MPITPKRNRFFFFLINLFHSAIDNSGEILQARAQNKRTDNRWKREREKKRLILHLRLKFNFLPKTMKNSFSFFLLIRRYTADDQKYFDLLR